MVTNALPLSYFCKKYSEVGYFVGAPKKAPLSRCFLLLRNLLPYAGDAVCGAHFMVVLQLSGFIIASGTGMLATRDTRFRARFCLRLPGRETTGQARTFLLECRLRKAARDSGNTD